MKINLEEVFNRIIDDFEYFCRVCIIVPARQWKKPPEEAEDIVDIPLILSSKQRGYIEYLNRKDIPDKVILKARQRGYSTVTLAYILWKILFGYNENIIYSIDHGVKAKEMARLMRRMFAQIPDVFKPKGLIWRSQPDRATNTRRNNQLLMKTADEELGRSGTLTQNFADEFASYKQNIQESIAASLTSGCPNNRVWISTPKRENDKYHLLVKEAQQNGTLYKHTYWEDAEEWFGSMENAKKWRARQEKGLTEAQIIRELDCGFKGAVEDTIWYIKPEFLVSNRVGANTRAIVSLDLGYEDPTAILWSKEISTPSGIKLYVFDELLTQRSTTPEVVQKILSRGYKIKYGVCDSSGVGRQQTSGKSSVHYLEAGLGCRFRTRKLPDRIEMHRIAQRELLLGNVFVNPDKCLSLIECFDNFAWENQRIPAKSKYKHIHDSFVYLVYNWLKYPTRSNRVKTIDRSSVGIYR